MYYDGFRNTSYKKYPGDDRFVPFAGPFLLGALTGGVATAVFNPYRPRPIPPRPYPPRPYPPRPYPPFEPYMY